ncbi:MAG: substrate-binding periplasmic protein [Pseudodesulfovibrio sp.]|uniref:Polar amino acid transport system substrate-binding protein n=2 Tax=Pseudodesulfovibrio indicus TaxID=1716143 RepID=A0AA94PR68_9BACT|nr:transporter substrate-binding domain-containing protein [Pseudodesulfovibrio indicus]TDT86306.1 polar amino acid transport system substrate-binding protein [Pseudodesulfovibrio indicus]
MTDLAAIAANPDGRMRRMGPMLLFAVLGLVLLFLLGSFPQARAPYRIGYFSDSLIAVEAKKRLEVVYARAGLPVEFVPMPPKRSLNLTVDGLLDGVTARVPGLDQEYPSLLQVCVTILDFEGAAYVIKGQNIGEYRESLLDVMKVGALSGGIWAREIMHGREMELPKSYESLFAMLQGGRIDIALANPLGADALLRNNPGQYANIERLDPLAFRAPFYHYLNEKNADIVPLLEKALQELRDEGYWDDQEG